MIAAFAVLTVLGTVNVMLLETMAIFTFISMLQNKDVERDVQTFVCASIHALIGLCYVLSFLFNTEIASGTVQSLWFILCIVLIIVANNGGEKVQRYITLASLASQALMPLVLLRLFVYRYQYKGKEVVLSALHRQQFVSFSFIAIAVISTAYAICKRLKKGTHFACGRSCIMPSGVIAAAFCAISVTTVGRTVSYDMHHPGELAIGFHQLMLGRVPYKDFFPVSGMFSYGFGALLSFFHDGMSSFFFASTVFNALSSALCVLAWGATVGPLNALFMACVLSFSTSWGGGTGYFRPTFMWLSTPILLMPKIRRCPVLWLSAYLLLSLIGGLWYPAFGAATVIGFLPSAIAQFASVMRHGEWKRVKISHYVIAVASVAVCILSLPCILGVLHETLWYAGSMTGEGIAILGGAAPAWFMPILKGGFKRTIVFDSIRFALPMFPIFAAVAILCKAWQKYSCRANKDYFFLRTLSGMSMVSLILGSVVSYSYSLLREAPGVFMGKAQYTVALSIAILTAVSFVRIRGMGKTLCIAMSVVMSIIAMGKGIFCDGPNILYRYNISDDYEVRENHAISFRRIGSGFVPTLILDKTIKYKTYADECQKANPFVKFYGLDYGLAYMADLSLCGQASFVALTSYALCEQNARIIGKEHPVVFLGPADERHINPYEAGYLCEYLALNKDYAWVPRLDALVPREMLTALQGGAQEETNRSLLFGGNGRMDIGNVPQSIGHSIGVMENNGAMECVAKNIAWQKDGGQYVLNVEQVFGAPLKGADADFLEVQMETPPRKTPRGIKAAIKEHIGSNGAKESIAASGRAIIDWDGGEGSVICNVGDGHLLIPLGFVMGYLLGTHKTIRLTLDDKAQGSKVLYGSLYLSRGPKLIDD